MRRCCVLIIVVAVLMVAAACSPVPVSPAGRLNPAVPKNEPTVAAAPTRAPAKAASSSNQKVIGYWICTNLLHGTEVEFDFRADGTLSQGQYSLREGTWEIRDNRITTTGDGIGDKLEIEERKGDDLSLRNDSMETLACKLSKPIRNLAQGIIGLWEVPGEGGETGWLAFMADGQAVNFDRTVGKAAQNYTLTGNGIHVQIGAKTHHWRVTDLTADTLTREGLPPLRRIDGIPDLPQQILGFWEFGSGYDRMISEFTADRRLIASLNGRSETSTYRFLFGRVLRIQASSAGGDAVSYVFVNKITSDVMDWGWSDPNVVTSHFERTTQP